MININNKYKEASPFDTIQKIRSILNNLGINVYEESWKEISSTCYSVHIEIDGFIGLGTNGKGTTRLFALASAYGELMERLQNNKIFSKSYGLKYPQQVFPDEKEMDLCEFCKNHPEIIGELVPNYKEQDFLYLIKKFPKLQSSVQFRDVFNSENIYLPYKLIAMSCGTNGMNAGNSSYESLTQGICEIMERYVCKKILIEKLELPTIPIEYLHTHIEDPNILHLLSIFEDNELEIQIKDCSIGGKYPVLGLLLLTKNKTHYQFKLGSDPIFSIALERCFTEIMQGLDINTIKHAMLPILIDPIKDNENAMINVAMISKNGTGHFPNKIFKASPFIPDFQSAFLSSSKSNKERYDHLISILKKNKFSLYIRNLSYLGFPTYKVYIPSMSEIFINNTNSIKNNIQLNYAAKCLLNIETSTDTDITTLLEVIETNMIDNTKDYTIKDNKIYKFLNLSLTPGNPFGTIDLRLLSSLLYYIRSDYKKSKFHFSAYLNSKKSTRYINFDYYKCVEGYLHYKSMNLPKEEIIDNLNFLFEKKIIDEVIKDFHIKTTNLLNFMPLPSCPNCDQCKLNKFCLKNKWLYYNQQLNKGINEFNSRFCQINNEE